MLAMPVEPGKLAAEVLAMRRKIEAASPRHDFKRGSGVWPMSKFIVQYLQLLHSSSGPDLLRPTCGTPWRGPGVPPRRSSAPTEERRAAATRTSSRTVEGRLRLIHNRSVSELPEDPALLERLARRLSDESTDPARAVESFLAEADRKSCRTARAVRAQIVVAGRGRVIGVRQQRSCHRSEPGARS